jgi:vancomycin resistance protein YoaR
MTTEPLEPFELKEQSKASAGNVPAESLAATSDEAASTELADEIAPSAQPSGPRLPRLPRLSRPEGFSLSARDLRLVGFAGAFAVGAVATLFLLSAMAFAFSSSYGNRVLPGVRAGSVDLSGLTRDEAMSRLQSGFGFLGQGEVTVTTPVGAATITYQQAGRGPDVEAMADAAMAVGHSGNPISDAASVIHSAAFGESVPVVILVDPTALAQRIHQLVGTSSVAPQDAQATAKGGNFSIAPSAPGRGIDERAMGAAIIDQLTETGAPADLQAGGTFTSLSPQVTDTDAQNAIARAQKMIVDVKLTWNTQPASVTGTWTPKSWPITAAQIRGWIVFGLRNDGSYAPAVDPAQVEAYLSTIAGKASIPATEPTVVWDADGKPVKLTAGKDGVGIDLAATTQAISAYLDTLATGGSGGASVEVVTGPIHPQIASVENVTGMEIIGSKTITFFPSESNGNGANIRVPAKNLNGQVIGPGQPFSFLSAVGPIDVAHGFAMGGVIVGGKSDHTGAIGGGICSASTTMFNAAANAGLQIDERHAHFYYINRYPVGRDATVYSNGSTTWDLRWTNDTPYPIVIRAWSTYGSQSSITIQLWSMPTNRTVTWSGGVQADTVKATDNPPRYVSTLKPGVTYRAEYPTDGFKTSTTRVVTDSTGAVIHKDTWASVYGVVNGQLQIGGTPPPSGSPSPSPGAPSPTPGAPTPVPTPAPTLVPTVTPVTPAPTASPTARRRKVK